MSQVAIVQCDICGAEQRADVAQTSSITLTAPRYHLRVDVCFVCSTRTLGAVRDMLEGLREQADLQDTEDAE